MDIDFLTEDSDLNAILGRSGDLVSGIDNDALDFSQLESYINENIGDAPSEFAAGLSGPDGSKYGSGLPAPDGSKYGSGLPTTDGAKYGPADADGLSQQTHLQGGFLACKTGHNQPHLPDSPPDSGSEPPFSPQDHPTQLHSPHQKPPRSGHLADLSEGQRSFLLSTGGRVTAPAGQYPAPALGQPQLPPPGHPPPQIQVSGIPGLPMASFPVGLQPQIPPCSAAGYAPSQQPPAHQPPHPPPHQQLSSPHQQPHAQHTPPHQQLASPHPQHPPHQQPTHPQQSHQHPPQQPQTGTAKKRKLSADNMLNLPIKEEPVTSPASIGGLPPNLPPTVTQSTLEEDDYTFDMSCNSGDLGPYMDPAFQCIRFTPFQQTNWHQTCDANLKELQTPFFKVDADKGFNYSNSDEAFVCQKKNHFQITCHIHQPTCRPHYVKTPEGLKKIDSFVVNFFGVKTESPNQSIKVEQSQSDRTKRCYKPVVVELNPEQTVKITVGRLHFSETTTNNMRKKGKPNPDQRYFFLVVSLQATVADTCHPLIQFASERIIVRASNPGQFESDVDLCWQKGQTQDSTYHMGRVGVNTDKPDEALVVHGNLKLTGHLMNPSDRRVKDDIEELDTKEQLSNVQKLRVVKYNYATEFAESVGLQESADTGVIAQEVQCILPDAVREAGDVVLSSGELIDNFLVVNKERIFMENIGAVKELCKVTGTLETRIDELERMNRRLAKLKRHGSLKSTSSISTVASRASSFLSATHFRKRKQSSRSGLLQNKMLQTGVCVLILVMLFCLISILALYILEWQKRQDLLADIHASNNGTSQEHNRTSSLPRPLSSSNGTITPSTNIFTNHTGDPPGRRKSKQDKNDDHVDISISLAGSSEVSLLEPGPPQGRIDSTGGPYSIGPATTMLPPHLPAVSPTKEDRTVAELPSTSPPRGTERDNYWHEDRDEIVTAGVLETTAGNIPVITSAPDLERRRGDETLTRNQTTSTTTSTSTTTTTTTIATTTTRTESPLVTKSSEEEIIVTTVKPAIEGIEQVTETVELTSTEEPIDTAETATTRAPETTSSKSSTSAAPTSPTSSTSPTTTPPSITSSASASTSSTSTTTTPSPTSPKEDSTMSSSTTAEPTVAVEARGMAPPSPGLSPPVRSGNLPAPASRSRARGFRLPLAIGVGESCRNTTCQVMCCRSQVLSERDRSESSLLPDSVLESLDDSVYDSESSDDDEDDFLDDLNATRLEPSAHLSDVRDNQIGYSGSSAGADTPLGKRTRGNAFPSEEEVRASQRYSGRRRMRFPPGDVTMANDALSGTQDWSKRNKEKKTTVPSLATRNWRRRRGRRRRLRTSRSTHPGFGYISSLRLREYPGLELDQRYCATDVPEYDDCVAGVGANFTFYIPVSSDMTRQMLHLEMHYTEKHRLAPAPMHCRAQLKPLPEPCAGQEPPAGAGSGRMSEPRRNGSRAGVPSFVVPLDAGRWLRRAYTFRIAVDVFPGLNPCRVPSNFVKSHFYQYNVIFERQCYH